MSQQAAELFTLDDYEDDACTDSEVAVIRLELKMLPALRAMDAAWLAYIREDFGKARIAAGNRYMAAHAHYEATYKAYRAALDAHHAIYPPR
jgi:hypothetical protein